MEDDRTVAEKSTDTLLGRGVVVNVLGFVGVACDLSMLATVISDLAGGRVLGIARRVLAASKRIEVGESRSAVAVGSDGVNVNVVGFVKVSINDSW